MAKLENKEVKVSAPHVQDPEIARALKQVYDDLNKLKDSVHNFKGKEEDDIAEGKEGDMRVVKNPKSNSYSLQIKGDGGWLEDKTAKYVPLKGDIDVENEHKKSSLPKSVGGLMPAPDYDSGWVAVLDDKSYTFTHNLGLTNPCRLSQIHISNAEAPALGTNPVIANFHVHDGGVFIHYKDSNTIGVETDTQLFDASGFGDGGAPADINASGYIRIYLWK